MHFSSRLIILLIALISTAQTTSACERLKAKARDKHLVNKRLERYLLTTPNYSMIRSQLVADDIRSFPNTQNDVKAAVVGGLLATTGSHAANNKDVDRANVVFSPQQKQLLQLKDPKNLKKAIIAKRDTIRGKSHHNQRLNQPKSGY
jgi:hypothetical protein